MMLRPGKMSRLALQKGISLVEVMVSFTLLIVLLTSVSTVFANSSQSVERSRWMTQANDLSQLVLERAFSCRFEEFQDGVQTFQPHELDESVPENGALNSKLQIVVTVGDDPSEDPRPYHVKVYELDDKGLQKVLLVANSTMISANQVQACQAAGG